MLLAGYLPWSLLVLFSLFCLRYRKLDCKGCCSGLASKIRNYDAISLYSFLSITLLFLFYCISASKRSVYVLPIYPFIAYFFHKNKYDIRPSDTVCVNSGDMPSSPCRPKKRCVLAIASSSGIK